MSLFKVICGVFRGPYIFTTLSEHTFGKVCRQLLAMVALCAALVYIGQYSILKLRWRETEAKFTAQFGHGLKFTDRGVLPEERSDVSRDLELPYSGMLLYSASNDKVEYDDEVLRMKNFILLWSSAGFGIALRSDDRWIFLHIDPEVSVNFKPEATNYVGMKAKLDAARKMPDSKKWYFTEKLDYMSVPDFFSRLRYYMAAVQTFNFFSATFFYTFVISGLFALFFAMFRALFRRKDLKKESTLLPALQIWKCGMYAAFPVIFVVSFFPAFQLMKPDNFFFFVFCGWSIYMIFILQGVYNFKKNQAEEIAANTGE